MLNLFVGATLTAVGFIAAFRGIKMLGKLANRFFDFLEGFLE